jgi:aminopeptidase N
MKRTLNTFLMLAFATWLFGQNDTYFDDIVCKEAEAHRHYFLPPTDAAALTDNYDLKYYRFEWFIDPGFYYIEGKATVYFQTLESNFSEINFDFSTALEVGSIQYHGQDLPFSKTGDYLLTAQLPAALAAGTLDSLTIEYEGAPPSGGFGSYIQSEHNGTPILWTLSEPFGAQDWWPTKNGLDDKIDSVDIIITTPSAYRAASNGLLLAETSQGNNKIYHWKHRYPIAPYLVAIAVTNYAQYTDQVPLGNGTTLPMLNYVYPENLSAAQSGTAALVKALQFYDSLFVTYPFHEEKYGHAQFGWGGGMEHQTMSFVVNYSWGLLTHELAHQWFGDMVTCGSWEDIWLNEGFATYLEGISRERFPSDQSWANWKQSRINNVTSQPGGSVQVDDTTSVGRIFSGRLSYSKGAYLLHMLRWKLGSEDFFQALRNYLDDRAFDYAKTPNLKAHLEAESGQDLSEFFQDWYEGQGFPSYQVLWQQDGSQVWVQLNQTTSSPVVDFFEMPVPIRFAGNGQDTIVRLEHAFSGQIFSLELPFGVASVQFDPDLWLLSNFNTVEEAVINANSEVLAANSIRLFPNPAGDFVQFEVENGMGAGPARWQLANALGQALKQGQVIEGQTFIKLEGLPAGLYFLQINFANGNRATQPFVKR